LLIRNEGLVYHVEYTLDVFLNVLVAKPEHPIAPIAQGSIADFVLHPIDVQAVLVRLHDQPAATAFEIGDVTPDRRLSAEIQAPAIRAAATTA